MGSGTSKHTVFQSFLDFTFVCTYHNLCDKCLDDSKTKMLHSGNRDIGEKRYILWFYYVVGVGEEGQKLFCYLVIGDR